MARHLPGSFRAGRDALMAGLVLAELGLDSSAAVGMTVNSLTLRQAQDGNGATPPWIPRRRSVCCAWM